MDFNMRLGILFCILVAAGLAVLEAHDVVLKTGKVVHGTLVKEDGESIVIKNPDGIEFTIKKKNVDLDKTAAANKQPAGASAVNKGRVYTQEDIAAMREKHNLGTFEGAVTIKLVKADPNEKPRMDQGFESEVLQSDIPVLVDFYADWCGPCKQISPRVDAVGAEFAGDAKVYRVNVDKNEELSRIYEISAIPTLLFFKDGELHGRMVGLVPQSKISEQLRTLVSPE